MPYIEVKLYPGKTDAEKKEFADKMIKFAASELGKPESAFSVGVVDVQPEDWNAEVADAVDEDIILAGTMFRAE